LKLVECVPNFSEGRRPDVIDEIMKAAGDVNDITILDCESDPNHNRMVLTFVGPPEAAKTAALAASAKAIELIDLTKHTGEHPRMGAVDVVPFVPLTEVTMEDCTILAKEFGREFAERFSVPVFLYESAATRPERKNLADVRQGQFEGLRELIGVDPAKKPDFGPEKIHPTAGATAVGARPILIAYNVNLASQDLTIAKKIAHKIRERDGGLPAVKALGFELKDRSLVQVSMNLTDYTKSSMHDVFDAISNLASESDVKVAESEIVGLVPQEAITKASVHYLSLRNFSPNQIIENRIFAAEAKSSSSKLVTLSLSDFADRVSSKSPTPGGGSVAAYTGALAASLVAMVCELTINRKKYEASWARAHEILGQSLELKSALLELVDQDSAAYEQVSVAFRLPKGTDEEKNIQQKRLVAALKIAAEVPKNTVQSSYRVFLLANDVGEIGNKNAVSDAQTAAQLSKAAILGAFDNVKINLDGLPPEETEYSQKIFQDLEPIVQEISR
jgi:glutamate formiminotransferase / formiminotetrahydrofolate cyclodeaminase